MSSRLGWSKITGDVRQTKDPNKHLFTSRSRHAPKHLETQTSIAVPKIQTSISAFQDRNQHQRISLATLGPLKNVEIYEGRDAKLLGV